jgi:hypothetical protein
MAANSPRAALTELGIMAAKGLDGLRELMAQGALDSGLYGIDKTTMGFSIP